MPLPSNGSIPSVAKYSVCFYTKHLDLVVREIATDGFAKAHIACFSACRGVRVVGKAVPSLLGEADAGVAAGMAVV